MAPDMYEKYTFILLFIWISYKFGELCGNFQQLIPASIIHILRNRKSNVTDSKRFSELANRRMHDGLSDPSGRGTPI
jgi:hypothetical protein